MRRSWARGSMDIIRWSISRPVSVTVGVFLVVLFGLIGLTAIPIQLTPTVDRPQVNVETVWPGRSPQEVVDEITRRQEKELKNVSNLKSMRSTSREGMAEINLEFYIGSSIPRAMQEVSDALRRVPDYPSEVREPTVRASSGETENAIAWIIIDVDPAYRERNPEYDITTLFTPMDEEVRPFLERIDGVAQVNIYGGRERQVHVMLDSASLAQRRLTHADVIAAMQRENRNVSAGTIAEGKRDIRVRVIGQYASPTEVMETVIAYRDGRPVYVRDVGTVEINYEKQRGFVRSLGEPCLAMNVIRQSGANVMDVMDELRTRLEEVRTDILPRLDPEAGAHLRLRQAYDETTYIRSSIDLVLSNLWKGGTLAAIVLLLLLRSVRATGIVGIAIPIAVIGTFLVVLAAGRTLNVISLAGLAFSTGMVVDNSIVVLENIVRRRSLGDGPLMAAYRGAREVWGAILASTLTTVAVFIPVLTIQEEAGQLFFDLSLALTVAVTLSLIVSITVVPAACRVVFGGFVDPKSAGKPRPRTAWEDLWGLVPRVAKIVASYASVVHWLATGWRAYSLRPLVILLLVVVSLGGARLLAPPLDYLPAGNRNLVFGGLLIPPGLSVDQQKQIAETIERGIRPYARADINKPETVAALAPIPRMDGSGKMFDPVPVNNFFIGAFRGGMFIGATSQVEQVVIPVGSLLTANMNSIPDAFGGARQSSIFGRGVGGGNSVNVEISGPSISRVTAAAQMMFGLAGQQFGFSNVRPEPTNFNLTQPEMRIRLRDAGRQLGLRTEDIGLAARGLFDGAFSGEYLDQGRNIDIVVLPPEGRLDYRERLADIPIATPAGPIVPLSSVVEVYEGRAPQEIQRIEELPAITLRVTPPTGQAVEDAMVIVRRELIAKVEEAGLIDPSMRVRLEGTAAKLDEVKKSLFGVAPIKGDRASWQTVLNVVGILIIVGGFVGASVAAFKAVSRRRGDFAYGSLAVVVLGILAGGALLGLAFAPQLLTARFVWALLVTYLLMCALFEDFFYPLVIMFSVPLAMVGGFAALAGVHRWTLMNPTIAPQQLDVLTMIGFVILIGTVVNNAILLVTQSLNFMNPARAGDEFAGEEPQPPLRAIESAVRTRVRPIFMTTLTTLGGGLPLVISPGAGAEMYRGLGAVVCGGLLVSTLFTLLLVPLTLSVVIDMRLGLRALLTRSVPVEKSPPAKPKPQVPEPVDGKTSDGKEPAEATVSA